MSFHFPFFNRNNFFRMIVHRIRLNFELPRMRFPRCSMIALFLWQQIFPILCAPQIQNLWKCGLGPLTRNSSHVAIFTSAYHHPGVSLYRCCGRNLNFNSADVKISCDLNLKNWSQCSLPWNRCIDPGTWIFARECVFSAG